MKASFLGLTGHWIDVKDGAWELWAEVLAFQALSGNHSSENLGRYLVSLCNHVGITNKASSKVCPIWLITI